MSILKTPTRKTILGQVIYPLICEVEKMFSEQWATKLSNMGEQYGGIGNNHFEVYLPIFKLEKFII
jgi:hypothetical protein